MSASDQSGYDQSNYLVKGFGHSPDGRSTLGFALSALVLTVGFLLMVIAVLVIGTAGSLLSGGAWRPVGRGLHIFAYALLVFDLIWFAVLMTGQARQFFFDTRNHGMA